MRRGSVLLWAVTGWLFFACGLQAQQSDSSVSNGSNPPAASQPSAGTIPRFIKFSGAVKDLAGKVPTNLIGITFSLYELPEGGNPLWTENQNLALDEQGHYTALLGSNSPNGLPLDLFSSSKALWLGVQPQLPGAAEQPRVLLVAVPYALKSADADTLGGLPPSAFMLAPGATAMLESSPLVPSPISFPPPNPVQPPASTSNAGAITGSGTLNFAAMFTGNSTIGNSPIFISPLGNVGIATTSPLSILDVNGTGNFRAALSGTAGTFSGAVTAGGIVLPALSTATATQGFNSNPIDLVASSFNSGTGVAVPQQFRWIAEPGDNNTASPSATLNLQFLSGSDAPSETGLSIASSGLITFASGQTFPGGGGGSVSEVTGTAPVTVSEGSTTPNISITAGGIGNSLLTNPSLTIHAGTGLAGGGSVALGSAVTLSNSGVLGVTATGPLSASSGQSPVITLSGIVGVANGGTGSNTQNFVDLTTSQSIGGNKTFTGNATFSNMINGNISGSAGSATTAATATNALALGGNAAASYSTTAQADARYLQLAGGTLTGSLNGTSGIFSGAGSFGGVLTQSGGSVLPATGAATTNGGFNSNGLQWTASVFNPETGTPVPQNFLWQAEPVGNNTPGAGATFNLLFSSGANTPAETGLAIGNNGQLTFASGQAFPGAVTSVSAGDSSITIGGTASAPTVTVSSAGITAANIAAGAVVRGINGQTDALTLAGANGLSVSGANGTITVSTNATAGNTASTLVSRDAFGNFSAGSVTLSGILALPNTSAGSVGALTMGGSPFLHNFGINNAFLGNAAGNLTLTGQNNSALGWSALSADTSGGTNTAVGSSALSSNTTGGNNAAFGYQAGVTQTAANANVTGSNDTFIGANSGPAGSTEVDNSAAIGANALVNCSNCIVLGDSTQPMMVGIGTNSPGQTLDVVGNVQATTFMGSGTNLTGISVLSAANTFTGQNVFTAAPTGSGASQGPLYVDPASAGAGQTLIGAAVGGTPKMMVDTNGTLTLAGTLSLPNTTSSTVGVISLGGTPFMHNYGTQNTFVGAGAGNLSMTGSSNAAFGTAALQSNTTGSSLTAFGVGALQADTVNFNSAFGYHALQSNTIGQSNAAFGANALQANTTSFANSAFGGGALQFSTGGSNTAVGAFSLFTNTTGTQNTAVGSNALYNNTTANFSSAFGVNALLDNTTGCCNNAFGTGALQGNTTGTLNEAFGGSALVANTTGSYNNAFGDRTLQSNTTGYQNSGFGWNALYANTSASFNSAFGSTALYSNTTGALNSAFGYQALYSATTANGISAFGAGALFADTTGSGNDAFGANTLGQNTTGGGNSAFGQGALAANTTGSANDAFGIYALWFNTTGSNNAAFGASALLSNTTGGSNSAFGINALYNNTTGGSDSAVGYSALNANNTGSLNSAFGVDALQNNSQNWGNSAFGVNALQFNNDPNVFSNASDNSAFGVSALGANTTGSSNSAFGYDALYTSTTSSNNSAFGFAAMFLIPAGNNNSAFGNNAMSGNPAGTQGGDDNSAFGAYALGYQNSGTDNSAFGFEALQGNSSTGVTGSYNSAFGASALQDNTTGANNSAFGYNALQNNDNGSSGGNDAFGFQALKANTSGFSNDAFGGDALYQNTTGVQNDAFGGCALCALTSGSNNIAIGANAGDVLSSGSYNIYIGNSGESSESDVIRLGTSQTATYIAGIYNETSSSGVEVFVDSSQKLGTSTSSRRYKHAITDMGAESELLMKLRPVSFYYKPELDKDQTRQYGLVAEEVAKIAPQLVLFDKDGLPQTVRYHFVNAMLLNEVQKQRRALDAQQSTIANQQDAITRQLAEIRDLATRLAQLDKAQSEERKVQEDQQKQWLDQVRALRSELQNLQSQLHATGNTLVAVRATTPR